MSETKANLKELSILFLKLGLTGFGGPAVHIAMMEEEVVRKRKWMAHHQFMDLLGATNLIPGPNSTEMVMHIGHERAGWKGLVVAGLCFIIPAVIITAALAWAYQKFGRLPQVEPFIYGVKPAIISVIVGLMFTLGSKALKNFELGIIGVLCLIASLTGVNEIFVLFGSGVLGVVYHVLKQGTAKKSFLPLVVMQAGKAATIKIFWIFLKIGAILYGSGYVLFAFINTELVERGYLTRRELIDAIAVGQFTPGPVFSSATFIGWQMAGVAGAAAATLGIFLPSFLFVALLNPLVAVLRKSKLTSVFLDTVNMASVAMIIAVCVEMGRDAISDWRTIIIAVGGLIAALYFRKLNTSFIILGGALLGYLLRVLFPQ